MSLIYHFFIQNWHLGAVTLVMAFIAASYLARFVWPAWRLKRVLAKAIQALAQKRTEHHSASLSLEEIERDVMTDPRLLHVWQQYAHSLHARWMPADEGPLGQARARVNTLSKAFFSEIRAASVGGRQDLAQIDQLTLNDPRMANLWQTYNQALESLQHMEAGGQSETGGWQATAPAEHHFSEHALVDSPLQTHFYKHVPGILTGVGIIGTFTGLISGLMQFDVSSPERVQLALSQLVQTVGQAFLISALAITLAMVFTWIEKAVLAARYRQVEDLQHSLDSLFTPKGGAEYMERLALATEMQAALSYKIFSQLRQNASSAHSRTP
jgi:hypothetical protein